MTGVSHTARINAIEVIVSSDKLIKMVNFELGNEMWKILSPRQESGSIPVGDSEFFFVPRSCHVD